MFNNPYNLDLLVLGVAVSSSLILGFIVYFKDKKSSTNLLFLLFTIASSLWSASNYLSYQIHDLFWSLWAVRVVMFFAVYQSFFFYSLVKTIPHKKVGLSKKWRLILYPLVIIVSILTLTPLVFSGVTINPDGPPSPEPAPGIAIFAVTAISLVAAGIAIVIKRARSSDKEIKTQFRFLAVGVVIMFLAIIVFNFIFVAVLGNSDFIPLSALFTLPFVVMAFYSIVKYRFLNVKIIGTEILVFLMVIITFMDVIFSKENSEIFFRMIVFAVSLFFSIFLIKSVINEVRQREELEKLTKKLREMDGQKDEFISMAAHELRAPMTAIKGFVSMVLDGDMGPIPDKAREFLGDANNINERLIRLVNNMLNVARIEEGRMVYQLEEESFSQIARTVFNQFVVEAKRKNLKYELEIGADLKDKIEIDGDRVGEAMGNIISNAIKYTAEGSVVVRLVNPRRGHIRFETVDTGSGISEKERKKLFRKFYRVESNVGKTTGTGLGLYISKLLIEKFGGEIGVDSEVGKGSVFWFEIPLAANGRE